MVTALIGLLRVSELKYKTAERREKRTEAKQERCAVCLEMQLMLDPPQEQNTTGCRSFDRSWGRASRNARRGLGKENSQLVCGLLVQYASDKGRQGGRGIWFARARSMQS